MTVFRQNTMQICAFLLFFEFVTIHGNGVGSASSYGDFMLKTELIRNCEKGSRPQKDTFFLLSSHLNAKGHNVVMYNFTVIRDTGPIRGRIRVLKWTNQRFEPSLSYNQDNVCKFFFPMGIVKALLKVDSKCSFIKETYSGEYDVDELVDGFLGKQFFFGKFKFRFEWFTKKQMTLCADAIIEILPKK